MSRFKVGDRVRAPEYAHAGYDVEGTITEDGTHDNIWIVVFDNGLSGSFRADELVPAVGCIRTVTRREIVPGEYTLPSGGEYEVSECDDGPEWIAIDDHDYDAVGLREMAAIFNQLAEVLEENAQ